MKLYSYVVARDFGFAPNPFFGTCSLATCKPDIRERAKVGDWVVGIQPKRKRPPVRLVFTMQIEEVLSFDEYFQDLRFACKKPSFNGSVKRTFGDNIYSSGTSGNWIQADSHHSHPDGSQNIRNIKTDTRAPRVLLSKRFAYWGGEGMPVPAQFTPSNGPTLVVGRALRSNFPTQFVTDFCTWFENQHDRGVIAHPDRWK